MLHLCNNCGRFYPDHTLKSEIPSLHERVEPGDTMPSGECRECGALVYPADLSRLDAIQLAAALNSVTEWLFCHSEPKFGLGTEATEREDGLDLYLSVTVHTMTRENKPTGALLLNHLIGRGDEIVRALNDMFPGNPDITEIAAALAEATKNNDQYDNL